MENIVSFGILNHRNNKIEPRLPPPPKKEWEMEQNCGRTLNSCHLANGLRKKYTWSTLGGAMMAWIGTYWIRKLGGGVRCEMVVQKMFKLDCPLCVVKQTNKVTSIKKPVLGNSFRKAWNGQKDANPFGKLRPSSRKILCAFENVRKMFLNKGFLFFPSLRGVYYCPAFAGVLSLLPFPWCIVIQVLVGRVSSSQLISKHLPQELWHFLALSPPPFEIVHLKIMPCFRLYEAYPVTSTSYMVSHRKGRRSGWWSIYGLCVLQSTLLFLGEGSPWLSWLCVHGPPCIAFQWSNPCLSQATRRGLRGIWWRVLFSVDCLMTNSHYFFLLLPYTNRAYNNKSQVWLLQ